MAVGVRFVLLLLETWGEDWLFGLYMTHDNSLIFINNRFVINRAKNEVSDQEKGEVTRLEPRLMKLLGLLVDKPGEVITREFIIKQVWDDYPGANEGLNQAISSLRKLLADGNKEIIQTLPKQGYSFHGLISWQPQNVSVKTTDNKRLKVIVAAILFLTILIVGLNYFNNHSSAVTAKRLTKEHAVVLSRMDSIQEAERLQRLAVVLSQMDSARQAENMQQLKKESDQDAKRISVTSSPDTL